MGAVALFADDDFRDALVRGVLIIDFIPVNKHDDVGVLFDGAGLAQVGHDRPLVGALFKAAVELGQGDNGHVQFLGHGLQGAGYLGNFRGAVLRRARNLH